MKNKIYCIYRLSIIYLEDNISLMTFRNIWQTHIPSHLLNEVENRKKVLFEDAKNYFIKKNGLNKFDHYLFKDSKKLKLNIGIKDISSEDYYQFDLDRIIHCNGSLKSDKQKDGKEQDNQYDSLFQNNSLYFHTYFVQVNSVLKSALLRMVEHSIYRYNKTYYLPPLP